MREYLKTKENVSNVQSFADFIGEELKRRNNPSGKMATAVINSSGGYFTADDDFQRGNCEFTRKLSEQWNYFASSLDRRYGHEEFLRFLQRLSPSIQNFHDLYSNMLDIRIIGRGEMQSNPYYINGEAASGYKIKYKMQDGELEENILPDHFVVKMPYAKGNYKTLYEIQVDLMYLNDGHGGLQILVQAPTFEQVEEQASLIISIIDLCITIKFLIFTSFVIF